jgi:hypothetical protein
MIDRERVYAYFAKFHGPVQPSTNGWYSCTCPICGRPKFAVNFDHLIGKCWRGCFKGFLFDVIQRYHGINHIETHELIDSMEPGIFRAPYTVRRAAKETRNILPHGYTPILSGNSVLAERARGYLKGRGFDLNYLDRIGVGYCTEPDKDPKHNYFGYIIIPFKRKGTVAYFIGRDFIGNAQRYKNPIREDLGVGKADFFFNEEALLLYDKIYLTEGWACAATIKERGVSMQGSIWSVIQKNIIFTSEVKDVIIIPDAEYYNNGLQMAYEIILRKRVKVLNLNAFYRNGFGKDVNEIGFDRVIALELDTPWTSMGSLFKEMSDARPISTREKK